jgi:hypothetical protein
MRTSLKDLLTKLEVASALGPYETFPWSVEEPSGDSSYSAEVRMGMDLDEIEAEIQILRSLPPKGKLPLEQVLYLRAAPVSGDGTWTLTALRIQGIDQSVTGVYAWEEKGCAFFAACVRVMRMGQVPDFDDIFEREFKSNERYGDSRGGGGGKSPKIKPGQLLDMKKGKGF